MKVKTKHIAFLLISLACCTSCYETRLIKQSASEKDGLQFLDHTKMYTKEKMNIDYFLNLDTINMVGSLDGLYPNTTESELEISFIFDRSNLMISNYSIDSISRLPDPNLPKRVNKRSGISYYFRSEDYIGKYFFTDSTISFNVLNRKDSLVKSEIVKYKVIIKKWKHNYDYEVELIKLYDDNTIYAQ